MDIYLEKNQILQLCNSDKKRYTLWIYAENNIIQVYDCFKPNTVQIWFQFNQFSRMYWIMMQSECIENVHGNLTYNISKLKKFMLKYLLYDTNIPSVILERDKYGCLTQKSLETVMKLHPRILRSLFNNIHIFPEQLSKSQQKNLQKQCSFLFGKGQSVSNPHKWISVYCCLTSFWQKFGMNYYDIMKLPNETFMILKKVMTLQSNYKSMSMHSK